MSSTPVKKSTPVTPIKTPTPSTNKSKSKQKNTQGNLIEWIIFILIFVVSIIGGIYIGKHPQYKKLMIPCSVLLFVVLFFLVYRMKSKATKLE